MNKIEKRAKEIYFQYDGNKFQMMRDGVNEEYLQYKIPDFQEKEWLKELINKKINQLDINNKDSLFPLWYIILNNCEPSYIQDLINFISTNKSKVKTPELFLAFTAKAEDIIERFEDNCKDSSFNMSRYKKQIKLLRENV